MFEKKGPSLFPLQIYSFAGLQYKDKYFYFKNKVLSCISRKPFTNSNYKKPALSPSSL